MDGIGSVRGWTGVSGNGRWSTVLAARGTSETGDRSQEWPVASPVPFLTTGGEHLAKAYQVLRGILGRGSPGSARVGGNAAPRGGADHVHQDQLHQQPSVQRAGLWRRRLLQLDPSPYPFVARIRGRRPEARPPAAAPLPLTLVPQSSTSPALHVASAGRS